MDVACMPVPDEEGKPGARSDKLSKEKMKGEMIGFMMKTAREFATRQVLACPPPLTNPPVT
jgi:hypothetical protein